MSEGERWRVTHYSNAGNGRTRVHYLVDEKVRHAAVFVPERFSHEAIAQTGRLLAELEFVNPNRFNRGKDN